MDFFRRSAYAPIFAALFGTGLLSIMDAIIKHLAIELGTYNTLFWRTVIGSVICLLIYYWHGGKKPSVKALRFHLVRGAVASAMAFFFFWGLVRTPLAEAIALSFIAPLIALYLAAIILKEKINPKAIYGSLLGFAGVVAIVSTRLGNGFTDDALLGALSVLLGSLFYAYNLILQRQQTAHSGPLEVALFQNLVMMGIYALIAPWQASLPPLTAWPWLILAACLISIALFYLSWAYARAEAQKLLATDYTAFLWGVALGWLFFDEELQPIAWVGTAMIILGCYLASKVQPKDSWQ